MTCRAEKAERRAVEAERQAEVAVGQVRALKLFIAAPRHQLEDTAASSSNLELVAGINRQARRKAERDAPRRRH